MSAYVVMLRERVTGPAAAAPYGGAAGAARAGTR